MEFGKHETFYLRNGWISKAINVLEKEENKSIFSPKNMGKAIDKLGIGRAMVVSLRYWLDVFDITKEDRENNEIIKKFTDFGEILKDEDRYLERKGTLWLLHYKLATAKEKATTWYWFFNIFKLNEFDDEIFINNLKEYIYQNGNKKVSDNTLKKDYLCLKNTYLYESYVNGNRDIEDIISSPLRELKLITNMGKRKTYFKTKGNINEIAPEIFYYTTIHEIPKEVNQVSIEDLTYKEKFPGKVFNLNMNDIYDIVSTLENKNYVKINRRYGSSYIEIIERNEKGILSNYYSNYKID